MHFVLLPERLAFPLCPFGTQSNAILQSPIRLQSAPVAGHLRVLLLRLRESAFPARIKWGILFEGKYSRILPILQEGERFFVNSSIFDEQISAAYIQIANGFCSAVGRMARRKKRDHDSIRNSTKMG